MIVNSGNSQGQFIPHFNAKNITHFCFIVGDFQNPHREFAEFELCNNLKFSREDEVNFDLCYSKKNSG